MDSSASSPEKLSVRSLRSNWWTAIFIGLFVVGSIIVYGQSFLVPLAVAVLLWQLINAIARLYGRLGFGDFRLPSWLAHLAAVATIFLLCWLTVSIITRNVSAVQQAAPTYQANLRVIVDNAINLLGLESVPSLASMVNQLDLAALIGRLTSAFGGFLGNAALVALYVIFLMMEQNSFRNRIDALFDDDNKRNRIRSLLIAIENRIERYLWIKTAVSLLTAVLCYAVLAVFGVDFAAFWSMIVFFFNFIPNVGSLFAVLLPSILTLVQFGSVTTFILVTGALSAIQFVVGSFIEPRMMGNSLNLSPLVIILSLTLWGTLWGIAGMFLCVPITVMVAMICAEFEASRPIAVLLSSNGQVQR